MNRLAIGYAASSEEADRPMMVFVETDEGILVQNREERAPKLLDRPETVRLSDGVVREVVPGDPAFFDVVLDSFSTRVFIKNITELEPGVLASMLVGDDANWDRLPRAAHKLAPA